MTLPDVTITVVDLDRARTDDSELLSADERLRADRLQFDELRQRYVTGRAAVRRALAQRVGVEAAGLSFEYGEHGRPDLVGHPGVSFNYSNSGGVGVLAISRAGRVGIDVEQSRAEFADLRIAERSFAPAEVAHLRDLPDDERAAGFLRCWTRKEALLKALGGGLTLRLKDFQVNFAADEPAQIVEPGTLLAGGDWQLDDVSPLVPGCVAAVALNRRI